MAAQRERNWEAICADLRDAKQTREHAPQIVHHLENCPDQPGPDSPYSPIGFPGRRQDLRQLLEGRCHATTGDDRQLYMDLLDALERR